MSFEPPQFPESSPLREGRLSTILVVDDHKPVRDTLQHVLQASGYRVLTAESGAAAVELVRDDFIDVALIDVHMHGMNGFECLRRIQELQGPVRAWLITGAPSKEVATAVAASGASGMLPKPFQLASLLTTLKEGLAAPIPTPVPTAEPPPE